MDSHAQQVADLEALTADFFAGAPLPQGRRVGSWPVAYSLRWLHDIKIASIIDGGAFNAVSPALAYAKAVGRPIPPAQWDHGFIQALDRDWPHLPTMEMKIARLRAFSKDLEVAW